MDFDEALDRFGFHIREERGFARGTRLHVASPNRFMTYMVHADPDGTAIFSWEFALGEFLLTRGIQVGSDETLNQFAYPREDVRGPQDGAWLASAIEQAEALLADVRLDRPEG
ncbi:MAG TPA: hypothetical protein VE800_04225 [Actinomycetota bacterium]|jgi:hypothetical protein|nr:hypothetical protein [Actinomycetota bacterium]